MPQATIWNQSTASGALSLDNSNRCPLCNQVLQLGFTQGGCYIFNQSASQNPFYLYKIAACCILLSKNM